MFRALLSAGASLTALFTHRTPPPHPCLPPRRVSFGSFRLSYDRRPSDFTFHPEDRRGQARCRMIDLSREEEAPARWLSGEGACRRPPPPGVVGKVKSPLNQTSGKAVSCCRLDAAARSAAKFKVHPVRSLAPEPRPFCSHKAVRREV